MELKRIALVFAFVMLFLSQACALELFYNASMNSKLNKQQFAQGESLEAEITVLNMEDFQTITTQARLVIGTTCSLKRRFLA
jgi:hypothetical protein